VLRSDGCDVNKRGAQLLANLQEVIEYRHFARVLETPKEYLGDNLVFVEWPLDQMRTGAALGPYHADAADQHVGDGIKAGLVVEGDPIDASVAFVEPGD